MQWQDFFQCSCKWTDNYIQRYDNKVQNSTVTEKLDTRLSDL